MTMTDEAMYVSCAASPTCPTQHSTLTTRPNITLRAKALLAEEGDLRKTQENQYFLK